MNPTEDGLFCEHYPYRQIHCSYYDLCLRHACEKDWCNFHCEACKDFEPEQLTQEERNAHLHNCIDPFSKILKNAA